jgi:aryl-alcohol dehydrogenase-like predicted oxidoreductase
VQFGLDYGIANSAGQVTPDEVRTILTEARRLGLDTLDTAVGYGTSEQRLGEAGIAGWRVVSKLPALPDQCDDVEAWVRSTTQESLRRLNVDRLHGLLLHRPAQLLESGGQRLYAALVALKRTGIVGKIGVSVYGPEELDRIAGQFELDLVQAPMNVFDRRLLESGWMDRLRQRGVELHVRSVFLQGLLLMPPHSRPAKFRKWQTLFSRWDEWVAQSRLTPLAACLRFILQFASIDRVVIGVDSARHLVELAGASDGPGVVPPEGVRSTDLDLLNPARWPSLDPAPIIG